MASLLFVTPVKAFTASIICMTLESFPLPIDDNIVIPIVAGLILTTI
jgi:dolichol kinase